MRVMRTPEDRFRDLPDHPFARRYLELDRMRLHYVDEGRGAPALLRHGEPTWSFRYRRIIPHVVGAGTRAVAPDYLGFGKSDKWADEAPYSYFLQEAQGDQIGREIARFLTGPGAPSLGFPGGRERNGRCGSG